MPRYRVNASVTGGKYIGEFEAESKEQAIEKAWDSPESFLCLCHNCSSQCENAELDIEEKNVELIEE